MTSPPPTRPPQSAPGLAEEARSRFWGEEELRLWLEGCRRVAVGVSGGADSMALLWLMAEGGGRRPSWAPEVVAAHVNHGLRGASADADQALAGALAGRLGVAFRYRRLDAELLRVEGARRGSIEDAARAARYGALRRIVRQEGCEALVLAHHQDDLAETFLMRLLRGSGLMGLGGFGPLAEAHGMRLVRPLIDWPRSEVRALARAAGLEWGEDETNRELAHLRNRVRHRILPYLERHGDHPPVARMLARTARRLDREGRALDAYVRGLYARCRLERRRPRRLGLPHRVLCEGEECVFAPYLLRLLMTDLLESAYPPEERRISELMDFARSAGPDALLQSARNAVAWAGPDGELWLYRKPRRKMPREELLRLFRAR